MRGPRWRRTAAPAEPAFGGNSCRQSASPLSRGSGARTLQTMLDLAITLDDLGWEQALESALRKQLITLADLDVAAGRGAPRIRRVLALRPTGAPPTESLLETLMVQLARTVPGLGPPVRQFEVFDEHGQFVARVDLAWPELGLFVELDGHTTSASLSTTLAAKPPSS